ACARARRLALAGVDGALQLRLVHARAAGNVELRRLLVELLARAALRALGARPQAAAAAGGDVPHRRSRPAARLALARALLVDRARRDLLGPGLRLALRQLAFLDVLVLPGSLGALGDASGGHAAPPFAAGRRCGLAVRGIVARKPGQL